MPIAEICALSAGLVAPFNFDEPSTETLSPSRMLTNALTLLELLIVSNPNTTCRRVVAARSTVSS